MDSADKKSPVDNLWIFVLAVVIISFLISAKRVYQRRQDAKQRIREENKQINTSNGVEICEKVSLEEYDYQSTVLTRQEVNKLINSEAYKQAFKAKGANIEEWNWQAKDRSNGILPKPDAETQLSSEEDSSDHA